MKAQMGLMVFAVFAMLLVSPFAMAEDAVVAVSDTASEDSVADAAVTETSTEVSAEVSEEAGTTPDSAIYFLDKAADSLSLALTFNKVKKAEKAIKIAQERLSEAEMMIEKNNQKAADKAQKEHDKAVQKAEDAMDAVEVDGDADANLEAVQNSEKVRGEIKTHAEKVAAVKNRILERKRATMSPEQIAHLEAVFGKIIAKAQEMQAKTEQKRENAKAKYKAMTGKTDAEVDSDVADVKAGKKVRNEVKTENAGEDSEIKTETSEQTAAGTETSEDTEVVTEVPADGGTNVVASVGDVIAVN